MLNHIQLLYDRFSMMQSLLKNEDGCTSLSFSTEANSSMGEEELLLALYMVLYPGCSRAV
jgi:hypothetical protein